MKLLILTLLLSVSALAGTRDVRSLNLEPSAERAAELLLFVHPEVEFTSGRRSVEDQARAMASNVVHNRAWIYQTYTPSEASVALQRWVDGHPGARTRKELSEGLLGVLDGMPPEQLAKLSKHLGGLAFDIQPIPDPGGEIRRSIRALPYLTKFLDREGGLVRWHAQFTEAK